MSKISDGLEMTYWKHGFYRSNGAKLTADDFALSSIAMVSDECGDEDKQWGLLLPLCERVEVPYEKYDGLVDIELTEPSIDPAAFWGTLQKHAPEVAKALADAAPRAGVTAVYPHPVHVGSDGLVISAVEHIHVFWSAQLGHWEEPLCAQLDKTKAYHMHITFVEAER